MKKKHKIFISPLLVTLIFLSVIEVSAGTYVGVEVGYWAKYRDICIWNSENPEAVEPSYVKDIENTKWRTVTVQAISGTTVTISVTRYFKNDTQETDTYSGDIVTGEGDDEFVFQIVPARLREGDVIWQSNLQINYTIGKEFAGVNRDTNYAGVTLKLEFVMIFEYYWDKTTGILCKSLLFDTEFWEGYKTTTWIETDLIETNIWHAENGLQPAGIEWWQPVIVVAVISAALILIRRKRRSKRRR